MQAGRGLGRMTASEDGSEACGEFARIAGLGQVVVGTQLQAEDPVERFTPSRQHQHGQLRMIAAQLLEQFQATAVRQHDVQHHHVRGRLAQLGAGVAAGVTGGDLEAFLFQPGTEQVAQFLVVVDQQYLTHGISLAVHPWVADGAPDRGPDRA